MDDLIIVDPVLLPGYLPPVSPRQIRQALTRMGLRDAVETAIAGGDQDGKDWWEFATEFQRHHSMVTTLAFLLNVTDEQLDELWRVAGGL